MNTKQVQQIVKGVIFFLFGLFDVILLIRLLLKFIGASTDSSFVTFWYNLSNTLYSPFEGTVKEVGSGRLVLEIDSIIAIFIYFLIAVIAIKIVVGIFKTQMKDKLKSLVDSAFKLTWGLLALRLFFKLIGAYKSSFISLLYGLSAPFYKPFEGLLPAIESGRIVIEISTIVAIVIIVILDFASEKLLDELTKGAGTGEKKVKTQPFTPFGSSAKPEQQSPPPSAQPEPQPEITPPPSTPSQAAPVYPQQPAPAQPVQKQPEQVQPEQAQPTASEPPFSAEPPQQTDPSRSVQPPQ